LVSLLGSQQFPHGGTGKLRTYRHLYLWCSKIIKRCTPLQNIFAVNFTMIARMFKCSAGTAFCMTLHDAKHYKNLLFLSFQASAPDAGIR
jgi:hypothetical protein